MSSSNGQSSNGNRASHLKTHIIPSMLRMIAGCIAMAVCISGVTGDEVVSTIADDISNLYPSEILLRLYDETLGFRWENNENWLSNPDVCVWYGITCYREDDDDESEGIIDERRIGHIRKIDLAGNHLQGTIPGVVYELPYLETIIVRDNADVTLTFESAKQAQYLKEIDISNTNVKSLDGIEALASSLETLHITNLGLTGTVPSQIFQLTNLQSLYANYNSFSGPLPKDIGYLTFLTDLYLYENELTGQLPTELGLLSKLTAMTLAQNSFGGTLPTELNQCTSLQQLAIHRIAGEEKGDGITGPLPSFSAFPELTELLLQNQKLSGPIPEDFLRASPKEESIKVDLTSNQLSGAIPESLADMQRMQLYVADNQITDVPTTLCNSIALWMGGSIATLGCNALLCPPGTSSSAGRKTTDESCANCSAAGQFWGSTACASSPSDQSGQTALVNDREILVNFYNRMGGQYWKNTNNWLNGAVTVCDWHGIQCENEQITGIVLPNNDMTNSLPTNIYSLPQLKILDLSSNSIDFKFNGISQARNLEKLYLNQCDLSSLDDIHELASTNIRELSLASNYLQDADLTELFSIRGLTYLDISHNRLDGSLPSQIGAMTNLVRSKLTGNNFNGQLPSQIGNLVQLVEMSWAENEFTGSLPAEIERLTNLETLSLHQTTSIYGIGGPLPAMRNLGKLTTLLLASNHLTGTLPQDFLENTQRGGYEEIQVLLNDNMLEGSIPNEWAGRFEQLIIDLAGNKITSIDDSICGLVSWMQGAVAKFSCDAILCPPGKYSPFGRQLQSDSICLDCPNANSNPFYGSKSCGSNNNSNGANINNGPVTSSDDEMQVLKEFFSSTDGNNWSNRRGWRESDDVCADWFGIECNAAGQVVSISLRENGLRGSFTTSIYKLPSLREIDLQHNEINFSFDGIGQATNLETLQLSGINLDSVNGIGNAQTLIELHLTDNDIKGTFPEEIFRLTSLKELYLNFNSLSGRIPVGISSLSSLEMLFLFHNRFEGQIPASIGLLSNLKTLSLSENNFSGTLPPELNDLTSLEVLALQREGGDTEASRGNVGVDQGNSNDKGRGITGPLLSFDNLPNIKQLYLGVNSLSGSIPYNFLNGVIDKESTIEIDLISNQLTGTVPGSLTQFDQLAIYLADNKISDIADGLCNKDKWLAGQVRQFNCDAILCPPHTYSEYGRQNGDSDCLPCSSDTSAPFYGSFDCFNEGEQQSLNERDILSSFYTATKGGSWRLKDNWLDPDESICSWHGVACVSGDVESVESINLEHNGLQGSIPTVIFELPHLRELNFARNPVDISFFGIRNAQKLQYLNLDSTNLQSLAGIENAENLLLLHANFNYLEGTFPAEVTKLRRLMVLDLSENSFPGSLPSSVQDMTSLVFFACSECDMSGSLPSWLGSLTNLESLQLDGNSFTGSLPDSLANLSEMKYLDLSRQMFNGGVGISGPLPSFSGLIHLTDLFLQHNEIDGGIPATFLQDVDSTEKVTVDLRGNRLTGSIPPELTRIDEMNIYLADNLIDEIPSVVCNTRWNDRAGSNEDCDFILCQNGTWNALGRATSDLPCNVCPSEAYAMFRGSTQCGPDLEKDIIEGIYLALGGNDWTHQDGWFEEEDICNWFGITCYDREGYLGGRVQKIDLSYNNLQGELATFIWQLEYMDELNLRHNDIDVNFTNIGNAQNLQQLQLSETKIKTMAGLKNAPSLKMVHLTNNDITGSIPDELFEMTQLEGLYLNYNELTGTLSSNIGMLSNLRELYLFHNKITGTIPSQFGELDDIEIISIGENKFTGTIPLELNWLPNLRLLALQREEVEVDPSLGFIFVVPDLGLTGPIPPFNNVPNLRELYLSNNHLQGTLPSRFLAGVNDKSATIRADLTNNLLHGEVPTSLVDFDDLRLYLAGNQIHFLPDEICAKEEWMNNGLEDGCDAFLCPPGTYNDYGRQIGAEICKTCNYRGSAIFYGSTTCGLMFPEGLDERSILREIYEETYGVGWLNSVGWMRDDVSICDWYGVKCVDFENGDTHKVIELSLPSNGLKGLVPSVVFFLRQLRVLNLRHNDVSIMFTDIERTPLEELYLDSTKLDSLSGIGKASNLKTLRLHRNLLGGQTLPDELFELTNLEVLDISESGLGGTLPSLIGNLRNLTSFLCHGNALTGEIPSTLGNLDRIEDLWLSENNFIGTLPSEMNNMISLQRLYLDSYDQRNVGITGPLLSFSKMPKISQVHLGSNLLTGTIPSDLFASVEDVSESIVIDLRSNHLTGTVPSSLAKFTIANIDVTDNMIEGVGEGLCSQSLWMDGAVGSYLCDGLLCPMGTYNEQGRQSSQDTPCVMCTDASPYLGRTSCISSQQRRERQILELFFQTTGGNKWTKNDGWMRDGVDVCDWYGISCRNNATVESIMLGSNNLIGTPPKELFELQDMKFLWLYSNPIEFSFEGIGDAKSLTSLLLDSTGLRSLDGIGDAIGLVDVDVRFNRLRGPLPEEIQNLRFLETFSCSSNQLSGPVPTFSQNTRLTTLRLGLNKFSGMLPSFSSHPALQSLDLSNNELHGEIPNDLLALADTSGRVFVDLSSNMLSGVVPSGLSRFEDLTLFLRDNKVEGVDPSICKKASWNEGDVGLFECDGILCPPNTYGPDTGRASRDGSSCLKCDGAEYFGTTHCGGHSYFHSAGSSNYRLGATVGYLVITIFSTMWLFI